MSGIVGYVGRVGSGKSYNMIMDAQRYRAKVQVYSNMGLTWAENIETWEELVSLGNALVLLDEIGVWFNARDYKNTPRLVNQFMMQTRKHDVELWWTAQSTKFVESVVRELTKTFWHCTRYGSIMVMRGLDPDESDRKRKYFGWRLRMISPAGCALYDTYAIVGQADGVGRGKGRASNRQVESRLTSLARTCWVRDVDDMGVVRYRRPQVVDLVNGAEVWEGPSDGFRARDYAELREYLISDWRARASA